MKDITNIKMKNINIEFPGVKALKNVDFEIASGDIRALIGANGAGKSTLMKILSGAYSHYGGEIIFNDKKVDIKTPLDSKKNGIEIVYQEVDVALIPYLTVGENIMLDFLVNKMPKKKIVDWKKIHTESQKILNKLGVKIDSKKIIQNLTLAQKQMVLIARSISQQCKFLILDEPTAPLSTYEVEELFRIVKDLSKNHNVGVIFISHRLPELFEICDTITIMKDGEIVKNADIVNLTSQDVVENMLGKKLEESYPKLNLEIGEIILETRNINDSTGVLKNININVRKGEIIGISGLVGAGKTELCKTIFGDFKIKSGDILINDKKIKMFSIVDAIKNGIALIPEERRKEGILTEESISNNLTITILKSLCKNGIFLNRGIENKKSKDIIKKLGIKTPNEHQRVGLLSGGNQQKVVIGKWILSDADIYIFDEPTKGVDIGAKNDIYELINELAKSGKGIIYASCEFPEILGLTNRTYIMYDGKIVRELKSKDTSEDELLFYSTGGK